MKQKPPIVKYNNGNPIALCKIICYVATSNPETDYGIVLYDHQNNSPVGIGEATPSYCSVCLDLLTNYKLNE